MNELKGTLSEIQKNNPSLSDNDLFDHSLQMLGNAVLTNFIDLRKPATMMVSKG